MGEWAVTANLGGTFTSDAIKTGMLEWSSRAMTVRRPMFIFAQEVFPSWIELVNDSTDYGVLWAYDTPWKTASAIAYRSDIDLSRLTAAVVPHLRYHGSYIVAGRWNRANGPLIVASIHASPNPAEPERYEWPADEPVRARDGGLDPRWVNGVVWDSDHVLVTLKALAEEGPLLAAGDLNESLLDDPEGGTWGREFFARVREFGMTSWLHERWTDSPQAERATRGQVQLDHVLVSNPSLLPIDPTPELDPAWDQPTAAAHLSDHRAVWFPIA